MATPGGRRRMGAWGTAAAAACCLLLLGVGLARGDDEHVLESVRVRAETDPVASKGDSADDSAIWYNAADPANSLIIGTDKNKDTGGLYLYHLNGTVLYYEPGGAPNNVDVRGDIVAATSRAANGIMVWHIGAEDLSLHSLGATSNLFNDDEEDEEIYGFCLYKSPVSGKLYAFVTTKSGKVVQYELVVDEGDSPVQVTQVRRFDVGSIAEGLVADDEYAKLYVSEENIALWQYNAEPDSDATTEARRAVDYVPEDDDYDEGHLSADIEGLTIYYAANKTGYLIASSQGDSTYAVYNRTGENEYLGSFRLVKNQDAGIDGTQETDGIDVIAKSLGPAYPHGLFVAQDGHNNDDKNQNFKLVAWENIASALDLVIDAASTNTTVPELAPALAPGPAPAGSAEGPTPPPVPAPPEAAVAPPPDETTAIPPPDASTPPPPAPEGVAPPPSPAPSPPPAPAPPPPSQEQVPPPPPPATGSEGTGDKTAAPPAGGIPEPSSSSSAGRWTFVFLVVVVLAVAGYFAYKRGWLARLPFWPFNSANQQQRPKAAYLQLRSFDRV